MRSSGNFSRFETNWEFLIYTANKIIPDKTFLPTDEPLQIDSQSNIIRQITSNIAFSNFDNFKPRLLKLKNMSDHPFLQNSPLPKWSSFAPECIRDDITLALSKAEDNLQTIRDLNLSEVNFENTVKALESSTRELDEAWGLIAHLDSVCNSEELRNAHNEMLPAISEFSAKIPLDAKLWEAIKCFAETDEAKKLPQIDQRLLSETIKDFQEAGADLASEKRHRLEEISSELAKVTQKFSENVLDATNNWQMVVKEEDKLSGLPPLQKVRPNRLRLKSLEMKKVRIVGFLLCMHLPCCPFFNIWKMKSLERKSGQQVIYLGLKNHLIIRISLKKYSHFARKKQRYLESLISQMWYSPVEWQKMEQMLIHLFQN